tara:strand:+ start:217 stop:891 length:675 start_codon:yes stop_codon:yes gene_type:complete
MSEIRVENIIGETGVDAVKFTKGINVTGVTTATTFSGSGASLTNLPAANLTGSLPAISGANLTGVSAGKILQVISVTKTDVASTTSTSYVAIPGLSASITPSSSSNKVLVTLCLGGFTGNDTIDFLLTNGASTGGVIIQGDNVSGRKSVSTGSYSGGGSTGQGWYGAEGRTIQKLDSPASTSQQTYYVYWRVNGNTGYLNRNQSDSSQYAFRTASTMTLMEVEV